VACAVVAGDDASLITDAAITLTRGEQCFVLSRVTRARRAAPEARPSSGDQKVHLGEGLPMESVCTTSGARGNKWLTWKNWPSTMT
jgi:hypothetical protein